MKDNVSVDPNTMWTLLLCTVRYAMGRQTGIVSETCNYVRRYHEHLETWQARQIAREIREELSRAERKVFYNTGFLGAKCDHEDWTKLAKFLEDRCGSEE